MGNLRTAALACCAALLVAAPAASADLSAFSPGQGELDGTVPTTMTGGNWSNLAGGVASRPFVKSLKVVNGGAVVAQFSGDVNAAYGARADGDVAAAVSPINLCAIGQSPGQQCYAIPNRVGISFGIKGQGGLNMDFSRPTTPPAVAVDQNTVFEVVVALNTLGQTLRWSWVNGELLSWKTVGLGTPDAEVRLRVKPAVTPLVDYATLGPNGCTATPINSCEIAQAAGSALEANLVLSLDDTLDPALTGTAFGTTSSLAGFLIPGGSAGAATLGLQMASAHLTADGALMQGSIRAFLPATALTALYGITPAEATSYFSATRTGDSGTQNAPVYEARSASDADDAGLVISITGITFSAPTYRLAAKAKVPVRIASKRGKLIASVRSLAACKGGRCTVTLSAQKSTFAKAKVIARGRSSRTGALTVSAKARSLPKHGRIQVVVRKGKKVLGSVSRAL